MKITKILFVIVLSLLYCNTTRASDLQILHEGTESLCFKITDVTNRALEVITNKEFSNTQYTGDIIIPDTVYLFYDWEAIPYRVTSIGKSAFRGCDSITNVSIPSSVTNIGDYAFYGCDGITSIEIPNNVTNVGDYAFCSCTGLTSVVIGNSVTSIGNYAFYGCGGITSITIPNNVTKLGNYAFRYCSALKTVVNFSLFTFNKKSDDYGEVAYYANKVINAPNGEFIDDFVFYTSDNENFLAGYIGNATELVLPENYKGENYHIGEQAFYSYTGLTSVTIPYCVTGIGDYSFYGCYNLTNITSFIPAGKLFAIGEYTFYRVDSKNCTLYVPYKAKEKYASTDGWKYFKNIVEFKDPEITFCATPQISYSNGKLFIECETEDAEFFTTVTSSYVKDYTTSEFDLSATYNICVYATANGYKDSDTVYATLCWIENGDDNDYTTEIINIPATAALITSTNGTLAISCSLNGENVAVYNTDGVLVGTTTIENGSATIATGLSKGTIAIVKIGEKSIKIIMQ